ncbi:uncharacterized protein LOC144557265 isoform X3 [Carex rostrata]
MEADPNMNFGSFSHYNNHQLPSFSWQYNDSSGFDGIGNPVSMSGNADAAPGISFVMPPGSSPANMALSPARRLVHGPAWSIKWTPHEQAILNQGLEEFANDPVITKYAKIATRLVNKTVRDVAMRCQWMKKKEQEKRQMIEQMHLRRSMHMRDRKERLASSSLEAYNHQHIQTASSSALPVMDSSHTNQNDPISSEVLRLLEENDRALDMIARNIEEGQIQNGALFNYVGSNIENLLLGRINGPNSSLRRMPPIPASINGDLFRAMWPSFSSMASTSSNFNLSEVPRRHS